MNECSEPDQVDIVSEQRVKENENWSSEASKLSSLTFRVCPNFIPFVILLPILLENLLTFRGGTIEAILIKRQDRSMALA